ncbi:transmembrane protein, putative (macronuclear) [Tetrahymena thermophila SB210]|uniref:Transmembrane protein, putative n=1 Tax=Tetrahymena thermophila (strain SB210) TaxID=312017 RepID=W7XHQ9_TETTS|nr:transmembrane protein, putative [Tetrahymena thermophila SB210]EWS72694.1 transmembrane protein, putative [Tetrahymena thermophila SB210]|eukprot:XP_012654770.1 transmembrane protein, putative [Tetrahymena thermophila SB210]
MLMDAYINAFKLFKIKVFLIYIIFISLLGETIRYVFYQFKVEQIQSFWSSIFYLIFCFLLKDFFDQKYFQDVQYQLHFIHLFIFINFRQIKMIISRISLVFQQLQQKAYLIISKQLKINYSIDSRFTWQSE